MDTPAPGYTHPTTRACYGLSPIRLRPYWAHHRKRMGINLSHPLSAYLLSVFSAIPERTNSLFHLFNRDSYLLRVSISGADIDKAFPLTCRLNLSACRYRRHLFIGTYITERPGSYIGKLLFLFIRQNNACLYFCRLSFFQPIRAFLYFYRLRVGIFFIIFPGIKEKNISCRNCLRLLHKKKNIPPARGRGNIACSASGNQGKKG